mmetsp:Transcript_10322/g.15811  ORF Transcript_10322/g.15811 Transcript_10322/m.15811 type:complete len:89 (-) Transcript_10322:375-641(-)|eukprot:CAMPEP_0170496622 /NCGR_PEP_ID=MMETSP0208-20121228/22270_1 /TAXON_ID=197538 /ORGANISM="Strombidium inclinatum, Strain S3" /LENGTH=88 /DNA_ID=CAMNT_0010773221 /DNA_START=215 /DNA_END=481 /DNA_ORIENTATION=-
MNKGSSSDKNKYFITVDEASSLKFWDYKSKQLMAEEPNVLNGALSTCAIDHYEGRIVACGGIDGVVHIFQANFDQKKKKNNDKTLKII